MNTFSSLMDFSQSALFFDNSFKFVILHTHTHTHTHTHIYIYIYIYIYIRRRDKNRHCNSVVIVTAGYRLAQITTNESNYGSVGCAGIQARVCVAINCDVARIVTP
jgi:hypothetical protein